MARVTAMSSIAYARYSLFDALPRIAERGYRRVEIGSFGNYCYHFNNGSPRPSELRSMLADHGLTPIALNWSSSIGRSYEADDIATWLEGYRHKIGDALEAGIPMMTMHFGRRLDGNRTEQRKIAAGVYADLAEYAKTQGMTMLLELPHMQLVHDDCESVIQLLDNLDHDNVGLLVDSSHWGVIGYDLDAFLDRVGNRLKHIHLRDSKPHSTPELDGKFKNPSLHPNPPYILTLTPGIGVVDFAALGAALDRIGYQGDVTTEFEYFDMPLDEIERQYAAGLAYIRKCGWELPATVSCEIEGS